jgi:hypothetical protein
MPAGVLLTVPLPVFVTVRRTLGAASNWAVTA